MTKPRALNRPLLLILKSHGVFHGPGLDNSFVLLTSKNLWKYLFPSTQLSLEFMAEGFGVVDLNFEEPRASKPESVLSLSFQLERNLATW